MSDYQQGTATKQHIIDVEIEVPIERRFQAMLPADLKKGMIALPMPLLQRLSEEINSLLLRDTLQWHELTMAIRKTVYKFEREQREKDQTDGAAPLPKVS